MGEGLRPGLERGDKGVEVGSTLDKDKYVSVGGDGQTNSGEARVFSMGGVVGATSSGDAAAATSANCSRGNNNKGSGGACAWAN